MVLANDEWAEWFPCQMRLFKELNLDTCTIRETVLMLRNFNIAKGDAERKKEDSHLTVRINADIWEPPTQILREKRALGVIEKYYIYRNSNENTAERSSSSSLNSESGNNNNNSNTNETIFMIDDSFKHKVQQGHYLNYHKWVCVFSLLSHIFSLFWCL